MWSLSHEVPGGVWHLGTGGRWRVPGPGEGALLSSVGRVSVWGDGEVLGRKGAGAARRCECPALAKKPVWFFSVK